MSTAPKSKQPQDAPLTSETLHARLADAKQQAEQVTPLPVEPTEPTVKPTEPEVAVMDRLALRPNETRAQEIGRFPGRQAAWEAADALVTAQKGSKAENLLHLGACDLQRCAHPAHVRARRPWRAHTPRDLGHLGRCEKEETACEDDAHLPGRPLTPIDRAHLLRCGKERTVCFDRAHLLPPRPLDLAGGYCCPYRCAPVGTAAAWMTCVCVNAHVRKRRQAEYEDNPNAFKGLFLPNGGFAEPLVLRRNYLAPDTAELLTLTANIKDPALTPLRED